MEAKLLTLPSINWPAFAHLTKKYLGETPTKKLDKMKIPCDTVQAYSMCLQDILPKEAFKLMSVSFVLEDKPTSIQRVTRYLETSLLDTTEGNQFCIASGSLEEWVYNVVNGCPLPLACAIYLEFYSNGLGFCFDSYKRVVHEEKKTFKLQLKDQT